MTTPLRAVRIPDRLWEQAQEQAQARGDNLSQIIRQALTTYTKEHNEAQ